MSNPIIPNKKDESLSHIRNDQEIQLSQVAPLKNKLSTKLQINKHFNCLYIYKNTAYLGTRNSKLYIYKISLKNNHNQNSYQHEDFILSDEKMITPHCQVVSMVKATDKYFVTIPESDQDSFISVWQAKHNMFLTALKGHKSQVSNLLFLQNNKYLATASWDCTIRIWNLQNLQRDQCVKKYTGNYPILQLKQLNKQILIFGGDDCYLYFWNWKTQQIVKKQFGHAGSVTYIEVMSSFIVTGGGDNKFKLWQVNEVKQQKKGKQLQEKEFKAKYAIKKIQQQKQQYDSIVYGKVIGNNLIIMDRQGQMFVLSSDKTIHRLPSHFQYNQNITGTQIFEQYLIVTTTKGCLKHFNIKQQIKQFSEHLEQQKNQQSVVVKVNNNQ